MKLSKNGIKKIKELKNRIIHPTLATLIFLLIISVFAFINFSEDDTATPEKDYLDYPFSVSFIDVGQGDCSLIKCNDINILVDGGEADNANTVLNYLKKNDIEKIDCYVLSHPHSDHIGSAATIMRSINCETVFTTYFSEFNVPTSYLYENLLDTIYKNIKEAVAVEAGDTYSFGDLQINIVAPIIESDDYNAMSIVFTATYGDTTVLFTGDTIAAVEKQILENEYNVDADLIKVAHHGSSTSSHEDFISAVSPEIAVISCGKNNSYGHPHTETMKILNEYEIDVYRTDRNGTIVYYGDGKTMQIGVEK